MSIVARSEVDDHAAVIDAMRAVVKRADPTLPLHTVERDREVKNAGVHVPINGWR
jgi:hypothetical protein